jgi:hypothetical protein
MRLVKELFVAEGQSKDKLKRIMHSNYLSRAFRSFASITGALFIFGHSMADSDDHIIDLIPKGKIEKLYVGIYGDPESDFNKEIIRKAERLPEMRKNYNPKKTLEVRLYDAGSANVWN